MEYYKIILNRKLIILASIHKDLDKIDSISLKLIQEVKFCANRPFTGTSLKYLPVK